MEFCWVQNSPAAKRDSSSICIPKHSQRRIIVTIRSKISAFQELPLRHALAQNIFINGIRPNNLLNPHKPPNKLRNLHEHRRRKQSQSFRLQPPSATHCGSISLLIHGTTVIFASSRQQLLNASSPSVPSRHTAHTTAQVTRWPLNRNFGTFSRYRTPLSLSTTLNLHLPSYGGGSERRKTQSGVTPENIPNATKRYPWLPRLDFLRLNPKSNLSNAPWGKPVS